MNVDTTHDSVLNSHICFNALTTLQHITNVENSCNFCSSSDHSTYICPVLSQGQHIFEQVKDASIENLSRSSVPHGLQVFENETGTHIISMQKFAKGCRFGPLLAPKSYIPIANTKFPLSIFGSTSLDIDAMNMPELRELFQVRNIHLDTRNEKYCNWMIHVDPAQYANEQNLVAYEEDSEIFFAAIEDLDVGDVLKVWYSPKYGERMRVSQLCYAPFPITKNIFQNGAYQMPDYQFFNNYNGCEPSRSSRTEISLPSIKNIIKPSSYVCYESHFVEVPKFAVPMEQQRENNISHLNNRILNLDDSFATKAIATTTEAFNANFDDDENVTATVSATEKDEKKVFPCQLCDKKYSTMTNIYRHVRAQHNLFLCSLCMNMFQLETELKEHIHKCPKSDVKKPQCIVCMQYFSNSWSLTRHIKIHVSAGECTADILGDRKVKERKCKEDTKDGIEFSDVDKNSSDSLPNEVISMIADPTMLTFAAIDDFEVTSISHVSADASDAIDSNSVTEQNCGENEISHCVVCEKRFKSKACLNKHMKSVHTVKVLSSNKRSATTNGNSKMLPSKRSQSNDVQSSTTHIGLPVNPFTAKALASKLNERNNLLNNQTNKMIESPSLKPILSNPNSNNSMSSAMISQTGVPSAPSSILNNPISDENHKVTIEFDEERPNEKNETTNGNNGTMSDENERNTSDDEREHRCELCGKKFSKKSDLQRHIAMHENATFACLYCDKVAKRKSGLIKHLRASHKDIEHLWKNSNELNNDVEPIHSTSGNCNKIIDPKFDRSDNVVKQKKLNAATLNRVKKMSVNCLKKNALKSSGHVSNGKMKNDTEKKLMNLMNNNNDDVKIIVEQTPPLSPTSSQFPLPQTTKTNFESTSTSTINSNQKQLAGGSANDDVTVNNIIDNCFFVDDTLNCNVVLHSPFSSDTDVDGFILSNSNEEHTMNKELLNKFHDRLEEMEEKIDNNDFKVFWNEMLDDDNDEQDDNANEELDDGIDDNSGGNNTNEFDCIQPMKQQINEFA